MDTDTIIYAVIAVVVLSRLWSVLGRRNEEDGERPNPFAAPEQSSAPARDDESPSSAAKPSELPPLLRPLRAAPDSLAGGLERIKELDSTFNEKQFLQGARAAFTMVVEDFFKGDLTDSEKILSPQVRKSFQDAIEARRQAGQVITHKLENLKEVECAAARTNDKKAIITVRFISEQTNIVHDAQGALISGEEGKIEEIIDLWTFARDTTSPDPNWSLIETKA